MKKNKDAVFIQLLYQLLIISFTSFIIFNAYLAFIYRIIVSNKIVDSVVLLTFNYVEISNIILYMIFNFKWIFFEDIYSTFFDFEIILFLKLSSIIILNILFQFLIIFINKKIFKNFKRSLLFSMIIILVYKFINLYIYLNVYY